MTLRPTNPRDKSCVSDVIMAVSVALNLRPSPSPQRRRHCVCCLASANLKD